MPVCVQINAVVLWGSIVIVSVSRLLHACCVRACAGRCAQGSGCRGGRHSGRPHVPIIPGGHRAVEQVLPGVTESCCILFT